MTYDEAVAYLSPHKQTSDTASISLTAGKMREAMRVILQERTRLTNLVRDLNDDLEAADRSNW